MFWTSLGYAQPGADQRLRSFMKEPRTLLIDLRLDPYSRYAEWQGDALLRTWGKRYRQAGKYLGNVNHATGGPILISRMEEGIQGLLRYLGEGWNPVLLCGCYNFHECHRATVVSALSERNPALLATYLIEDTPFPGAMNCLSINPPWSEILIRAHLFRALDQVPKNIECRSWSTPWRGRLAIHAGKTFDTGLFKKKMLNPLYWQDRFGTLAASVIPLHKDQYTCGAIIGYADLVDIVTESDSPWYVPGQYGFVFENIVPIDPVPWGGKPRLFQILEETIMGQKGVK